MHREYLLHNYPNPFNPRTTISFNLPQETAVRLRVYDLSGHLVRTLLNGGVVQEGRNEVVWNGRDDSGQRAASGVYFYCLEAAGYSETKRMVLVK
jgi:flagellar hook assembly protein FlgD